MKTYLTFACMLLLIISFGILSPVSGQWEVYNLTINQNSPVWGFVGDLDGDDTLDYVATHNKTNKVVWYKNINAGQIWEEYTISDSLNGAWMAWIADIDGDDDLDVVATGQKAHYVVWYENNGGTPINWTPYFIDPNLYDARDVAVADIDGDDTLDVIVSSYAGDDVVWYENNHPNWPEYVIEDNLNGANYICPADLDGDSDPDLIVGGWSADRIVWYKNNHPNWNTHDIDPDIDGPVFVDVADLDDDDDLDVVATGENDNDVVWYENDQLTWHKYIIDGNLDDALGVTIGDMDGDDIPDVIAAGIDAHKVVWYKNNLPSDHWTPYTIGYLEYSAGVDVGDIDNDNDLDVVSSSYGAYVGINVGNVVWYKNPFPLGIEKTDGSIPYQYSLSQNYPNPFNPTTTIEFSLPKTEFTTLKIYNLLGQEVTSILSDKLNAGSYKYEWNSGEIASGVYYYRLVAGNYVDTKKLVVLK